MQGLASELNLSETAFLHPDGPVWSLRWFTPRLEVDLCGHATLASAHVLWEREKVAGHLPVLFDTKSGRLRAEKSGDWIVLDFPADPVKVVSTPRALAEALGQDAERTLQGRFDYLVELASEDAVRSLAPDFAKLLQLEMRGLIVTARGNKVDFVSRFFAPGAGVPEDPVTGSAHCTLACYWHGRTKKSVFQAEQISARGGQVRVELVGDRVKLGGQAVTVLRGSLLV